MYPFSLSPILRAAHTGHHQEFFKDFDTSNGPQYWYTKSAWASRANGGLLNTFAYVLNNESLSGGAPHTLDKLGQAANCTNPEIVFGDVLGNDGAGAQMNLWSCALYPNLTHDFRASALAPESRQWVLGNNTDTSPVTSTRVTNFLATCLAAWCDNEEGCGKTKCRPNQLTIKSRHNGSGAGFEVERLNAAALDTCLDSICGYSLISSPDIAGIGVVVSIFMQLALTLVLPLALLYCHLYITRLVGKIERPTDHTAKEDNGAAYKKIVRKKIGWWQTFRQGVLSTLDDFHRAQCCFAIAIDIASLITLFSGHERVTRIDRNAITLASFAGTLPTLVVFCALLLHKEDGLPYTVYLTCFTWLLSLITGYLPLTSLLSPPHDIGMFSPDYIGAQPLECGRMSPTQVCEEWGVESRQMSWIISISSVCTIFLILMYYVIPLAYNLYDSRLPKKWRDQVSKSFPKPIQGRVQPRVSRRYCSLGMQQGLRALVYVAMIAGMTNCGLYVGMILEYIEKGEINTEWGFGQVVAVSVWMPTIMAGGRDCIWGA